MDMHNATKIVTMKDLSMKVTIQNNLVTAHWTSSQRGNIAQVTAMLSNILIDHSKKMGKFTRTSPYRFTNSKDGHVTTVKIQYAVLKKNIGSYIIQEHKLFDYIYPSAEAVNIKDVFYVDLLDYMALFTGHVFKDTRTGEYSTRKWNEVEVQDIITEEDLKRQGFSFPKTHVDLMNLIR